MKDSFMIILSWFGCRISYMGVRAGVGQSLLPLIVVQFRNQVDFINTPSPEYFVGQDASITGRVSKACNVMIEASTDLELIHQDQNPDFLIEKGVKRPIARRVVVTWNTGSRSSSEPGLRSDMC
jgi:hypothetical protein